VLNPLEVVLFENLPPTICNRHVLILTPTPPKYIKLLKTKQFFFIPPQPLIHSLIRRFRSVSSQAPHGFTAHSFRLSRCSGLLQSVYTRCFVPRTRCINFLFEGFVPARRVP